MLDAAGKADARANAANKRMYAHFADEIGRSTGSGVIHLEYANFRKPVESLLRQAHAKFGTSDPIVRALLKARSAHP